MINCIAIDDEPLALDIITTYSEKIPFINLLKTFESPLDAIEYLKDNEVDLIFLDIQMEDVTGVQFLNILKVHPMIIFTTAYDDYAMEGFELEIEDYLLKPFAFERFLKATNKVLEKKLYLNSKKDSISVNQNNESNNNQSEFIFLKVGFDIIKINLSEILYIEGQLDYLKVITSSKNHMVLQSFKEMENILPKMSFIRIHKSYIVAIDKIVSIKKNKIHIINNTVLPIGSMYKQMLFSHLKNNNLLPK